MSKWEYKPFKDEEFKLSKENGEKALREVLDTYAFGLQDKGKVNDLQLKQDIEAAERGLENIVDCYRAGVLQNKVDADKGFCIVQKLADGSEFVYREACGEDWEFITNYEGKMKVYEILGRLSGFGANVIKKLKGRDLRVAEAVGNLFILAS